MQFSVYSRDDLLYISGALENEFTVHQDLPPASVKPSPVDSLPKQPARVGSFKAPKVAQQHRVIKYPVQLTLEERRKFDKTCMYLRWFWNDMLAYLNMRHKVLRCFSKKVPLVSEFDGTAIITELRNNAMDMEYLNAVSTHALRDVSALLLKSYKLAVSGKSKKDKDGKGGWPKFKGRYGSPIHSIAFENCTIKDEEIWLGRFLHGSARIWRHKQFEETIQEARLVKTVKGFEVHVSLRKDAPAEKPIQTVAGIDVGLKDLVTRSDGVTFNFTPHTKVKLVRLEKRLRCRKRKLARCQKWSKRRKRSKLKVAKTYARIKRTKEHAMQAIACECVNNIDAVVIEGFNPHNLTGGRLGNSIQNVAFGKLWSMIRWQCVKVGKMVVEAPANFASSKLCSRCGVKNVELTLSDRTWTCQVCNTPHNRDVNAAKNLEQFGVGKLSDSGKLAVKDGIVDRNVRLPERCDAVKSAYGLSQRPEDRKSCNQRWFVRGFVEPSGLANTVIRGNLDEWRKPLTEGVLVE